MKIAVDKNDLEHAYELARYLNLMLHHKVFSNNLDLDGTLKLLESKLLFLCENGVSEEKSFSLNNIKALGVNNENKT